MKYHQEQKLDEGIIEAVWMSYEDIINNEAKMRGPMVRQLVEHYRAGKLYPLDVLNEDS